MEVEPRPVYVGEQVLRPRRATNGITTPESQEWKRGKKEKGREVPEEVRMVEQRVLEDGPERTVSIWGAEAQAGQSERDSHARGWTRLNVLKEQGRKQSRSSRSVKLLDKVCALSVVVLAAKMGVGDAIEHSRVPHAANKQQHVGRTCTEL